MENDPLFVHPVDAPHLRLHKNNGFEVQRHHPRGQASEENILFYFYITTNLHDRIHSQGKWSREKGWIAPEFEGRKSKPNQPKPWLKLK